MAVKWVLRQSQNIISELVVSLEINNINRDFFILIIEWGKFSFQNQTEKSYNIFEFSHMSSAFDDTINAADDNFNNSDDAFNSHPTVSSSFKLSTYRFGTSESLETAYYETGKKIFDSFL